MSCTKSIQWFIDIIFRFKNFIQLSFYITVSLDTLIQIKFQIARQVHQLTLEY
jgi:hypothetical protein